MPRLGFEEVREDKLGVICHSLVAERCLHDWRVISGSLLWRGPNLFDLLLRLLLLMGTSQLHDKVLLQRWLYDVLVQIHY